MFAGNIVAPSRIQLIDVPEASLDGAAQIVFQPRLACLCGSDLPFFLMNGEWPLEIGHSLHEMIGTVVDTNGSRYRPGDRVLCVPVDQRGLFERFAVAEDRAIPLADRVTPELALLSQPLGTVIYALKKLPNVVDCDVAVVGAGPIGHMFCAGLHNLGARRIVAVDRLESRLQTVAQVGATATVCNAGLDPQQTADAVRDVLGELPEIVVEAVGHGDQAFNHCIALCRPHGRLLYFGVPPEHVDGLRWRDLVFKNVTVHTSINPDFRRDFPLAMQWIVEGRVNLSPLLTHRYHVQDVQSAFETFRDRRNGALKVLLDFPGGPSESSQVVVREALPADAATLAAMNQRLIEDEGSRNRMSLDELAQRMTGWLQSGWTATIVTAGDEPVGYALFQTRPDEYRPDRREVYLRQFFIERAHRGRGMGRAAYSQIASTCFPADARVVLDTLESNPPATRFWQSLGFEPYAHTFVGGQTISSVMRPSRWTRPESS